MPTGPTVLSCQPASGMFGTKVYVKISSHYDLFAMSTPMPYFFLVFGAERCPAQDVTRDAQDSSGFFYSCNADAPQFMVTRCQNSNVPLSLLLEGPSGEDILRTVVGSFQYLEGSGDDITRLAKVPKHDNAAPATTADQPSPCPKTEPRLASEAPTNTYEYPTQQGQQYANTLPEGNNEMISTYRTPSFTDPHYHRRPAPGWSAYPSTLGSTGRGMDPSMSGRQSLASLAMSSPGNGTPQLIRTSTINNSGNQGAYNPISLYSSKAVLKITGKLDAMADNWTQEEWDNQRRIVVFRKSQLGSTLSASFRAVPINERPTNSICISCIYWQKKGECYVTSVDTIHLLEQLVAAPARFSVEEKNRIRRNLEGFHPLTVSKAKAESEEFFKLIMGFPNPKPRNIEKDVKVFPWKILEQALKKIIGKYSASPSSTLPPANMTPVNGYAPLPPPPPPGHSIASSHDSHGQYPLPSHHHDAIPSPRSLSGSQPSWTPYAATGPSYSTAASRTLSPSIRHPSPQVPHIPLRINTNALPAVSSYDSRTITAGSYATSGLHTPLDHPHSTATPPRWDPTPASYPESYPSLSTHHHHAAQPVYTAGGYDGAPRA